MEAHAPLSNLRRAAAAAATAPDKRLHDSSDNVEDDAEDGDSEGGHEETASTASASVVNYTRVCWAAATLSSAAVDDRDSHHDAHEEDVDGDPWDGEKGDAGRTADEEE